MAKGSEVLVRVISGSLNDVAPGLKDVLEAHLRVTLHRGLEIAYEDPKAFKGAVEKLFGEYSARLLELIILQRLKAQFGWLDGPSTLEEAVERVRRIYGE